MCNSWENQAINYKLYQHTHTCNHAHDGDDFTLDQQKGSNHTVFCRFTCMDVNHLLNFFVSLSKSNHSLSILCNYFMTEWGWMVLIGLCFSSSYHIMAPPLMKSQYLQINIVGSAIHWLDCFWRGLLPNCRIIWIMESGSELLRISWVWNRIKLFNVHMHKVEGRNAVKFDITPRHTWLPWIHQLLLTCWQLGDRARVSLLPELVRWTGLHILSS